MNKKRVPSERSVQNASTANLPLPDTFHAEKEPTKRARLVSETKALTTAALDLQKDKTAILDIAKIAQKCTAEPIEHDRGKIALPIRVGTYNNGIAYLGSRIAAALGYLHVRGVTHQDLKLANILVTPNGDPILLDSNLATEVSQDFPAVGGTVPYMAPERLNDLIEHKVKIGFPSSDIFSLGVVLYELLTGHLPFGEPTQQPTYLESAREMLRRTCTPPIPIENWNKNCSSALSDLVISCLNSHPNQRPDSAADIAQKRCEIANDKAPQRKTDLYPLHHLTAALVAILVMMVVLIGLGTGWATTPAAGKKTPTTKLAVKVARLAERADASPDNPDVWFNLAQAYAATKQWEHFFDSLTKMDLLQRPAAGHALALHAYGLAKFRTRGIEWGMYEEASAQGYKQAWSVHNCAVAFFKREHYYAAHKRADLVLETYPQSAATYYLRALSSLRLLKEHPHLTSVDEAMSDVSEALKLTPDDPAVLLLAAEVFSWRAACNLDSADSYRELARHYALLAAQFGIGRRQLRESTRIPKKIRDEAAKSAICEFSKNPHCIEFEMKPPADLLYGHFAKYATHLP